MTPPPAVPPEMPADDVDEMAEYFAKLDAAHKHDILACIVCGKVCGKEMEHPGYTMFPERFSQQPSDAVTFYSYGHYGSTFWDSLEGEQVVLNVCDDCLRERRDRLAFIRLKRTHPEVWVQFDPDVPAAASPSGAPEDTP